VPNVPRRPLIGLTVVLVALTAADAFAERIRCGSQDYRYASCEMRGRVVSVRVARRHSKRPCILNYTWGWRRDTIWVDDGCDADFDVVMRGPGGGGPPLPGPPPYPGPPPTATPPAWAIGEWRTGDLRLNVYRGGSVVLVNGRDHDRGYMDGDLVMLYDGTRLRADRDRRGMRLIWPNGRGLYLSRVRAFDY
jgi:DUF3011 family protein